MILNVGTSAVRSSTRRTVEFCWTVSFVVIAALYAAFVWTELDCDVVF
jgi:hypothetical protein